MPTVHYRKARKDYPQSGIKKGDMYYTTKLRMQRGGLTKRSLKPFRQSQLTLSEYKSSFLSVMEAWEDAEAPTGEDISAAAEQIREISENCGERYENMPESLQEGDTGQLLYNRQEECESKADELDTLAVEWDELEEPTEPVEVGEIEFDPSDFAEETSEMNPEDVGEFLSGKEQEHAERYHDYLDELDEYEIAQAEYDSEIEWIVSEAAELIGDMPE